MAGGLLIVHTTPKMAKELSRLRFELVVWKLQHFGPPQETRSPFGNQVLAAESGSKTCGLDNWGVPFRRYVLERVRIDPQPILIEYSLIDTCSVEGLATLKRKSSPPPFEVLVVLRRSD